MKQKTILIGFSMVLLLMAGCRQPEFEFTLAESHILSATLESNPSTKTHLEGPFDGIYYPFWTKGDALAVYVDGLSTPDKYVLATGAGTGKGDFAGTVAGSQYVALYPYAYRVPGGLKGDVLTLELPAEQIYAEKSFGEGAFPMLAAGGEDGLSFKNLCSVLKVSMTGDASVKSVRFVAHDTTMAVSGRATVRTDYASVPELKMEKGGLHKVTLQCTSVQLFEDEPTDFFLVIPSGTYRGGFSVEIETFSGSFTREVNADVTFGRSQFRYIAPFRCDADGVIDPDDIPYNQIWYVTDNSSILHPSEGDFDRNIVSNTYSNGKGVLVFDGPVTRVGDYVFCDIVSSVHLPNSIESIGRGAFYNSKITSFRTPDKLKSLGVNAFRYCNQLSRFYGAHASADGNAIILEDGTLASYIVGSLGESLTIPDGVTTIAYGVFMDSPLREIIIPEGVTTIEDDCFYNSQQLEVVSMPASLNKLSWSAFMYCPSLRQFKGDCSMIIGDRFLMDEDGMAFFYASAGGGEDCVMPEGIVELYNTTFRDNKTIRSITFPSTLQDLYNRSFYGCDNLEFFYGPQTTDDHHGLVIHGDFLAGVTHILPANYVIPDGYGITRIFMQVFQGISSVERITIPDSVRETWGQTFIDMPNLRTVVVSSEMVEFGGNDFDNCPKLDTLYLRSYAPPSYIGNSLAHDGLVIYVPEGTENTYKSCSFWSDHAEYIHGYHYDDLQAPDYYISTDFSQDGVVSVLQTASEGRGIDIVLMGDGYSDRQIADGTYDAVMHQMADAFFGEEPYKSYRNLFNVYSVNVVSSTEGYEHGGQALSGYFGDGTLVGGNDGRCMDYARKIVAEERMNDALIIVAMNSPAYAGTCWMYYPTEGDYGSGTSVAYFPVGQTEEGLAQLVHHEAGGHGFAKLADEYAYENNGTIPDSEIQNRKMNEPFGWWKNADFTSDPQEVKWAYFLNDSRYQYDGLGVFEGAFTYWKGAYRPTENSIMRYNTGGFNAPSREAIWYRIHKLAYGTDWVYDYEDFVAYDVVNRKTSAAAAGAWDPQRTSTLRPTHPPVVVGKTWKQAMDESRQDNPVRGTRK